MLEVERARLGKFLQDRHPKMVKLQEQIDKAKTLDQLLRTQDRKQLEATRQALQSKIAGLKELVKEWEIKVRTASRDIAEADRLKLNVSRIQAEYDVYVGLLRSIDISRSFDQDTLGILQPASPAWRSYRR